MWFPKIQLRVEGSPVEESPGLGHCLVPVTTGDAMGLGGEQAV